MCGGRAHTYHLSHTWLGRVAQAASATRPAYRTEPAGGGSPRRDLDGPAAPRPGHRRTSARGRVPAHGLDYLTLLRHELAAFQERLSGDLTAPVGHCGRWTLRDLAEHVGQGNLWVVAAVRERHGAHEPPPAPADIVAWFAATSRLLAETLAVDPATGAWTFAPPRTVGFWRRRRWLETLVHRWDAQRALGVPDELDAVQCADGVAEVVEVFVPRQVRLGRMPAPAAAVRFTATDLGTSWTIGPGEPVAALRGTAPELLLALWNRLPWTRLAGDAGRARAVLPGPLVP
ncbi:maleylpyruvate isomerase family mycothiol-dependent enzyme [Actinoplanes teichomyceticus]|uniref:Uncharacterized protein (TIGR03083 family) n=1 Tax=Actinoplanes teichomyceticus TaxID=1867 RepID=A0A561VM44_ACTTI|nr:maleylpyruvate isomerase family mycothiol-dependent enzyme [Actinoplanes teichomyceticus]TWG12699.1 uncharacterized protein (TIGR03083 family) [Actinoplanes teichomyceticus]GIF13432.1 hypothetical protein Ate01nite_34640 [Actinoplanes teichomyceticus]